MAAQPDLPDLTESLPLTDIQKIVADRLFPHIWSPNIEPYQRYKFFREYLGVQTTTDEDVPIVGVGIGGSEDSPVLAFLSTVSNADVEML